MSETSIESIAVMKNESMFIGDRKSKNCEYLDLIKHLLKALAIAVGSVRIALLSMMTLVDV